jgi:predicted trehalose synthase
MKKIIFFVSLMFLSLSASTVFASKSDPTAVPAKTENKLTADEMSRLKNRVVEIRDMDKTNLTVKEKRELRKELKVIKETVKKDGGYVYIGGTTLLLIIILIILI